MGISTSDLFARSIPDLHLRIDIAGPTNPSLYSSFKPSKIVASGRAVLALSSPVGIYLNPRPSRETVPGIEETVSVLPHVGRPSEVLECLCLRADNMSREKSPFTTRLSMSSWTLGWPKRRRLPLCCANAPFPEDESFLVWVVRVPMDRARSQVRNCVSSSSLLGGLSLTVLVGRT